MDKLYWVIGTKTDSLGVVTRMLCGQSVEKMKRDLEKNGYTFESKREMIVPRFVGKEVRW